MSLNKGALSSLASVPGFVEQSLEIAFLSIQEIGDVLTEDSSTPPFQIQF